MEIEEGKKVSKGYRLKPETHELIKEVKKIIEGDSDKAINTVCKSFLKEKNINKLINTGKPANE